LRATRAPCSNSRMCNLYSIDIGQQAIRDIAKAMRDVTGTSLPKVSRVNVMVCGKMSAYYFHN
jgi:hypothetical protein